MFTPSECFSVNVTIGTLDWSRTYLICPTIVKAGVDADTYA